MAMQLHLPGRSVPVAGDPMTNDRNYLAYAEPAGAWQLGHHVPLRERRVMTFVACRTQHQGMCRCSVNARP